MSHYPPDYWADGCVSFSFPISTTTTWQFIWNLFCFSSYFVIFAPLPAHENAILRDQQDSAEFASALFNLLAELEDHPDHALDIQATIRLVVNTTTVCQSCYAILKVEDNQRSAVSITSSVLNLFTKPSSLVIL